jgi:hypothetical protein
MNECTLIRVICGEVNQKRNTEFIAVSIIPMFCSIQYIFTISYSIVFLQELTVTQMVKSSSPLWNPNVLKMKERKYAECILTFGRNISSDLER